MASNAHSVGTDALGLYILQIGDSPMLSREEERELARRTDEGAEDAERKLIRLVRCSDDPASGFALAGYAALRRAA